MQETAHRKSPRFSRRATWIAAAIAVVLAGTVTSYAATDGWQFWSVMMQIDESGVITNADGDAIGMSVDNEDGTSTTIIEYGNDGAHLGFDTEHSLKGQELEVLVVPADEAETAAHHLPAPHHRAVGTFAPADETEPAASPPTE